MCRWLAYSGSPIRLEEFLVKPRPLAGRPEPALADGRHHDERRRVRRRLVRRDRGRPAADVPQHPSGLERPEPARGGGQHPLAAVLRAHPGVHRRRRSRRPTRHPFRHGRWLWMHNGAIREFDKSMHELRMAVDPDLFPSIEGTTDSETMFYLALTFGLEDDPPAAVERMVGFVEQAGRAHGVEHPIQMTVATTDGERIWAFRYSSEGQSRSLFYSTRIDQLRQLHPEVPRAGRPLGRVPAGRLGAARRPARRLERGTGGAVGLRRARPGRDAPVPAANRVAGTLPRQWPTRTAPARCPARPPGRETWRRRCASSCAPRRAAPACCCWRPSPRCSGSTSTRRRTTTFGRPSWRSGWATTRSRSTSAAG